ncbi:hypothetical protein [Pinirhizobacter soli]|uniref:hypothetical protein n=1 Tax=Pinirhizobacter soli TaxID=2786953 RepID=UPI00202A59B3|nr:hypothetical protein [Pinirhizobacter soli]
MTSHSGQSSREELQARRRALASAARIEKNRLAHGPGIVEALSHATLDELSLTDFHAGMKPPFCLQWPPKIENAPGLLAAYVNKQRAIQVAICIQATLQQTGGLLGIHGNEYLGFADVKAVNTPGLVVACEAAIDSVIFFPHDFHGAIVFDCYEGLPGNTPFSVLIQGLQLEELLAHCL